MTETEKTLLIRRLKQLPHLSINDIIKKEKQPYEAAGGGVLQAGKPRLNGGKSIPGSKHIV
jgi:hypothetical protein